MNDLVGKTLDPKSFAMKDLMGIDRWEEFTPTFGALTVVGDPTYTGRYRIVGAQCHFQVTLIATTSIESTAGTDYFALPIAAKGIAGMAVMTDATTNIAVGVCHIDVANGRCYIPTQAASGDSFSICGSYEI
jgi:hypothetical protein